LIFVIRHRSVNVSPACPRFSNIILSDSSPDSCCNWLSAQIHFSRLSETNYQFLYPSDTQPVFLCLDAICLSLLTKSQTRAYHSSGSKSPDPQRDGSGSMWWIKWYLGGCSQSIFLFSPANSHTSNFSI
jgi:hypothetical protein